MFNSIIKLFSGSVIGRVIGFFRFQAILLVFGQGNLSDRIIYLVTFIWLVNNFFVIPLVNRDLIAKLGKCNDEWEEEIFIKERFRSLVVSSLVLGLLSVSFLFLYGIFVESIIQFDFVTLLFSLLTLVLLGVNELFSLFNQFKGRYFLYSLNPSIWNSVLLLVVGAYWLFNWQSIWIYFFFLFIGVLISLSIQYRFSKLKFAKNWITFNFRRFKSIKLESPFYQLSIIMFSAISFFDLNILSVTSFVGAVTLYSVILKLPELTQSIVNSAFLPVVFNEIVLKQTKTLSGLLKFVILCILAFGALAIVYQFLANEVFIFLFKTDVSEHKNALFGGLLYMLVSSITYLMIRLSVEFNFQRIVFYSCTLGLVTKVVSIFLMPNTLFSVVLSNLFALSPVLISGLFCLLVSIRKSNRLIV